MENQEENSLPSCLLRRKRKLSSLTQFQNNMLYGNSSKTAKQDDFTNENNESTSSFGSVIENTNEDISDSTKDTGIGFSPQPKDILLKQHQTSNSYNKLVKNPSKRKTQSNKVVILSNIVLTPKQSKYLEKNKETIPLQKDSFPSSSDCVPKQVIVLNSPSNKLSDSTTNVTSQLNLDVPELSNKVTDLLSAIELPHVSDDATISPTGSVLGIENNALLPDKVTISSADLVLNSPSHDVTVNNESDLKHTFCSPFHDASIEVDLESSKNVLEPEENSLSPSMLDSTFIEELENPQPSTSVLNQNVLCNKNKNDSIPDKKKSKRLQPSTSVLNQNVLCNKNKNDSIPDKKKSKRLQVQKFKKSCIDFISDEEKDFSDGSSDNWTAKESESSSDEEKCQNKSKKKKKTTKKGKITEELKIISKKRVKKPNKKNQLKKAREQGKAYISKSGKEMAEKALQENPCIEGKCGKICHEIAEERRKSLFKFYWALDPQRRRDWLVRCAKRGPIKRQKTKQDISRRQTTYEYYLNDGEDHVQVCQQFLLKTLNITQKFLLYTIKNANDGMAQSEKRRSNAPVIDQSTKVYARKFIEELPAVPSHYCRKGSTCVYLPQEFKNLSNLYRLYLQECRNQDFPSLTETTFTKMFKEEYNIRFHTPKKDKCSLCVAYENNPEKEPTDIINMKKHKEEKQATYLRFKIHQNLLDNKTVVCSFDLQKVLNTPYGESMLLYYSRKYAVYNLTMYESGTQNVSCYIWGECDGKRGANDIATCLFKYLKEVDDRGLQNVLLYCDSCSGQNKNKVILATINYFLHTSKSVEVVQINYLLPGHTYMPVDSVHAVIENEVKKVIVWSPDQWPTYIECARKRPKPYNVNVMEYSDFINWNYVTDNTFTTSSLKQFKMRDIRVATFKKKDLKKVELKYSMKDDAETHTVLLFEKTSVKGKGKGKRVKGQKTNELQMTSNKSLLPSLYENRLCISKAKYKDLSNLCKKNIIPRRFHNLYLNLPTADDDFDVLPETDEEEMENENTD